ncbi:MAG: hypothetical protein FWD65_06920 [Coriobacteriia bacterium]|nr:hypothetical protein [Coriobacteriia bacterium]
MKFSRDKALIITGAWILVMWLSLFTRNFPFIIIIFLLLAIPLALVFWDRHPWKRRQIVTVIIELVVAAPILVLLIMTALMGQS